MQVVSIAFLSKFCRRLFESVCKVLSHVSRDERAGWFLSDFMAEFILIWLWICFLLSQLIRLNDLRLFFNRFHYEGAGHTKERGSKCLPLREHCESKVSCSRTQRIVLASSRTRASRRGVQCTDH